jgi:hypothetical protein
MSKQFLKNSFLWGFILWLIGYALGIILFPVVPLNMIGWIITPIGIIITLWVLIKKIKNQTPRQYFLMAIIWTLIAIVLDYFLLVKLFKPVDGYYKLDVYLYYILTFILPLIYGWSKNNNKK